MKKIKKIENVFGIILWMFWAFYGVVATWKGTMIHPLVLVVISIACLSLQIDKFLLALED